MAELAGLTLAVASVGGLFSNCVELAEYISLARNMGSDYEASYTKFLLLKSRLVSCGEQLKSVFDGRQEPSIGTERSEDEDERCRQSAARSLVAIASLLENVKELEGKYGLRREGEGDDLRLRLQDGHSSALREVERGLQSSAKQRQQKTSFGRKIVWAVRDRKAFDRLIADFAFHVDELENLAVRVGRGAGVQSFESLMPSLPMEMSPAAVSLLNTAASESDVKSSQNENEGYGGEPVASRGHLYLRNIIQERARVMQGDVGECGPQTRRHIFEENVISGGSKVVQGNVAYDFMEDFWKE